jgi:transcription initiation factor TFIID subunit 12
LGLGVIGAAQQQGHSHAHPPQPQTATLNLQPKLPIAKTLHEKAAQMPTPVPNIGGIGNNTSRPTYSGGGGIGGGVMNQPALNKAPAYQLEGEGERILNKKKLDELVRQVCGGTAEGQEGNLLTPEVEEVRMLHLSSL